MTTVWNDNFDLEPSDTEAYGGGAADIRTLKVATRERIEIGHNIDTGVHKQGTACIFVRSTPPTWSGENTVLRDGILWFDTTAGLLKVYDTSLAPTYWRAATNTDVLSASTSVKALEIEGLYFHDGDISSSFTEGAGQHADTLADSVLFLSASKVKLPATAVSGDITLAAGKSLLGASKVGTNCVNLSGGAPTVPVAGDLWLA